MSPTITYWNLSAVETYQQALESFIIQNVGGADLILESFVINEWEPPYSVVPDISPNPTDFLILTPDQSLTVQVYFNPQDVGYYNQRLSIRSNNKGQSTADIYEITLNGMLPIWCWR